MLRAVLLLCAALSAGLLSGPADARSRDRDRYRGDPEEMRDAERQERQERRERRDGAAEAGRRAQMRNGGGRVLSVEPMGGGYRVKVLKDGVVRVYIIEDN
jgi:hypothetical protein